MADNKAALADAFEKAARIAAEPRKPGYARRGIEVTVWDYCSDGAEGDFTFKLTRREALRIAAHLRRAPSTRTTVP